MEDEAFLEAALDDRSKEVRTGAAELLARLPQSRLARRMAERALALVSYKRGLFPSLELLLPQAYSKELQRDGIPQKPPSSMGERAWWLRKILERTPPATWSAAWALTPEKIVRTRISTEWRPLLLGAWATAASAYGDGHWARALAQDAGAELEADQLAELLQVLPADRREEVLITLLTDNTRPFGRAHPALPALRLGGPWGHALARAVIAALARRLSPLSDDAYMDWQLRAALERFALAIPPELGEEALAALPAELAAAGQWADAARTFAERLRLRRAMHAALRAGE